MRTRVPTSPWPGTAPDPSGGSRAVFADFLSLGSIAGTSLATVVPASVASSPPRGPSSLASGFAPVQPRTSRDLRGLPNASAPVGGSSFCVPAGCFWRGRAANSWLRRSLDRRRVLRHGQDDREGDPLAPGLSAGFGLGGVFLGRADRVRVSDGASSFPVRAGPGLGPRTPTPSVLVHHGTFGPGPSISPVASGRRNAGRLGSRSADVFRSGFGAGHELAVQRPHARKKTPAAVIVAIAAVKSSIGVASTLGFLF